MIEKLWRVLGHLFGVLVGLTFYAPIFFWPVLLFGWDGWTALYVGFMMGRFLKFEFFDQERGRAARKLEEMKRRHPSAAVIPENSQPIRREDFR